MSGLTAEQFNTPAQKVAFARAVEDALTVDADVTNVVATNVARRRLSRRQLQPTNVIDVDYTLQVAIAEGAFRSVYTSHSTHQ